MDFNFHNHTVNSVANKVDDLLYRNYNFCCFTFSHNHMYHFFHKYLFFISYNKYNNLVIICLTYFFNDGYFSIITIYHTHHAAIDLIYSIDLYKLF